MERSGAHRRRLGRAICACLRGTWCRPARRSRSRAERTRTRRRTRGSRPADLHAAARREQNAAQHTQHRAHTVYSTQHRQSSTPVSQKRRQRGNNVAARCSARAAPCGAVRCVPANERRLTAASRWVKSVAIVSRISFAGSRAAASSRRSKFRGSDARRDAHRLAPAAAADAAAAAAEAEAAAAPLSRAPSPAAEPTPEVSLPLPEVLGDDDNVDDAKDDEEPASGAWFTEENGADAAGGEGWAAAADAPGARSAAALRRALMTVCE